MNTAAAIAHPTKSGFWTIRVDGRIYLEYARRELAVAILLTR